MLIVVSISSSDFVTQLVGGGQETEKYQPKFQCIQRPHTLPTLSPQSHCTLTTLSPHSHHTLKTLTTISPRNKTCETKSVKQKM